MSYCKKTTICITDNFNSFKKIMSTTKSGILRRSSIVASPFQQQLLSSPTVSTFRPIHGANMGSPMQTRSVHFEPPPNLRDLLIRASNEKTYNPKLLEELEGHLTHLKNQRGQALLSWLQLLQENIRSVLITDVVWRLDYRGEERIK